MLPLIEFWKLHGLLTTVSILMLAGTGLAQEPAGRKLYPVDESHLDPSFAEFKARLLEAVERQDFDFLLSIAHPQLRLSIEDPPNISGQENLQRLWTSMREVDKTQAWQELRDMLSLGAVQSTSGFCAPYATVKFPHMPHAIDYLAITASDAPIKAEPKSTAPIIDHLSYDIVKRLWRGDRSGWETVGGERYPWHRIETPSGETGYAWGKYVARWLDTTVCFHKTDGQWLMTSWSGGD